MSLRVAPLVEYEGIETEAPRSNPLFQKIASPLATLGLAMTCTKRNYLEYFFMNKERIATAFLIVLTNTIGATVILPMLPLYVEKQFKATPLQSTLVIAMFYVAQIWAAPWLGKLSDRFGRRPILIISQAGTILAFLMFFFAAQLGAGLERFGLSLSLSGGLLIIYLARIVDGLTGGNVSVAEAYASDISDDKSRTQALGLIGGAVGVGHILGPALAAILSGFGLLAPIIGAAVMSAVTLLLTVILLEETVTAEKKTTVINMDSSPSIHSLLSKRPIALVITTAFVIGSYVAAVMTTFSLYAERALFPDQPPQIVARNSGVVIVLMGLGVAVSQMLLVGQLTKHLGEQTVVILGSLLLIASAIGFGLATSARTVIFPILIYALGYSISWPSLQSIMTRFGSKETVGKLLGLFQSVFSLALILAPIAAGLILEKIGPRAVFFDGAWLMGLATVLAIIVGHIDLPHRETALAEDDARSDQRNFLKRFHG
jgi:DHA1 family tetracycline resistance protein-like MFS transporter